VSVSSDSRNPSLRVLLRSEETDGRIAVIESTMPAGAPGPPSGSSRGISAATSRLLAFNDVRDVVNGRGEDAVNNTAVDRIREARGQATGIAVDATERSTMNTPPGARRRSASTGSSGSSSRRARDDQDD
jgi:hypothetical protein